MRPILLIMWTAFQSLILRDDVDDDDNNNNNNNNNNDNNNDFITVFPLKGGSSFVKFTLILKIIIVIIILIKSYSHIWIFAILSHPGR